MKTRAEHMAWCKTRALEYVIEGNLNEAFASMCSDLGKHPETAGHTGIQLGVVMTMGGQLGTTDRMRKWIEGFD